MTAGAFSFNPDEHNRDAGQYDRSTPAQARFLRAAIQELSQQGDLYHDDYTGLDTWGFSRPLDSTDVQLLPKTVTQHFPEADGPISGYDVISMWSPQDIGGRPEDALNDSIAVERTVIHPSWKEVVTVQYSLVEPTPVNKSGIKREILVEETPISHMPPGTDVERRHTAGEWMRATYEATKRMDNPYTPNPDEQAWSEAFDELAEPQISEASQLISFVRGFAARQR